MNTQAAKTTVRFVTSPRTIIARSAVTGQMVKLGSFDNYFLAEPVMRAAIAAGLTGVEMLISLPAAC
jgi:hypothetical protein